MTSWWVSNNSSAAKYRPDCLTASISKSLKASPLATRSRNSRLATAYRPVGFGTPLISMRNCLNRNLSKSVRRGRQENADPSYRTPFVRSSRNTGIERVPRQRRCAKVRNGSRIRAQYAIRDQECAPQNSEVSRRTDRGFATRARPPPLRACTRASFRGSRDSRNAAICRKNTSAAWALRA